MAETDSPAKKRMRLGMTSAAQVPVMEIQDVSVVHRFPKGPIVTMGVGQISQCIYAVINEDCVSSVHCVHSNGDVFCIDMKYINVRSIAVSSDTYYLNNEMCAISELAMFPPDLLPICIAYASEDTIYVANNGQIGCVRLHGKSNCSHVELDDIGDEEHNRYITCCSTNHLGVVFVGGFTRFGHACNNVRMYDRLGTMVRSWDIDNDAYYLSCTTSTVYVGDGEATISRIMINGDKTIDEKWNPSTFFDGYVTLMKSVYEEHDGTIHVLCAHEQDAPQTIHRLHTLRPDGSSLRICKVPMISLIVKGWTTDSFFFIDSRENAIVSAKLPTMSSI